MTHNQAFFKRRWKTILNVVTIVALVALVFAIRHELVDVFNNFGKVNLWLLTLIIPLTVIGYHAQTKMYQGLFGLLGNKLPYRHVMRVALELNFVNNVFPSGGVSGISYFGVRMRSEGDKITATKASLVQIMKLLIVFISFEILLVVGLVLMAAGGQANDLVILVAGSISTLLAVGTFAFVMIIGSERRIHATFAGLARLINRVIQVFRPSHPETIAIKRAEGIVQDLHYNYKMIESNIPRLKGPFFWALVLNVTAILALYMVYGAFGSWVNLGAIILGYSVANFAGLVSVLPGGAGIYEALMTGVLAAAGIPIALSLPATIMFRVISAAVQLPPGYFLYHQTVHGARLREGLAIPKDDKL